MLPRTYHRGEIIEVELDRGGVREGHDGSPRIGVKVKSNQDTLNEVNLCRELIMKV